MTYLANGTVATDLDNHSTNRNLLDQGYTVRHIETHHRDTDHTAIIWDAPSLNETDLPF
jgi:hypothetical protein